MQNEFEPGAHDNHHGSNMPSSHEPGCEDVTSMVDAPMAALQLTRPLLHLPQPNLCHFLLNTSLNTMLASYLSTRDLFFLQFLNRDIFTLCNSNGHLLQVYYSSCHLDSFIPFMVDDAFLQAFLTPSYLDLPDGSKAVRNTYSMHIKHLYLNYCSRISNHALSCISNFVGSNLLTLNLEGGGRSRINEHGIRQLFQACFNLTDLNLNGCYQLNMVETMNSMTTHCKQLRSLSLNGCSQMNESAVLILSRHLRLQKLYLNCSNVTDNSIGHIASSMKELLEVFHIGYSGSVTDRGIATLVTYCHHIRDLSLYGCYSLSRHALSYLRLCPRLEVVDLSRIHSLDDSSIAEWILPTSLLKQQQAAVLQYIQQQQHQQAHHPSLAHTPAGASAASSSHLTHPDYNPNLAQIFAAAASAKAAAAAAAAASSASSVSSIHSAFLDDSNVTYLRKLSLDSCSRLTSLGLKVILEHSPNLVHLNAFGIANLTPLALQSLLQYVFDHRRPLETIEVGGGAPLKPREMEILRATFTNIKF